MAQSKVQFDKQHTPCGPDALCSPDTPSSPGTPCSQDMASDMASDKALSAREVEIVYWISIGKSDGDIGQILGISPKTVNYHVEKVKRKYAVSTRIQAIVAVVKDGLI